MNRGVKSFNGFQKKVLAGCFIVYLCTYIGRLNLSATLDDIILEFGIDKARGGLLQTVFAAFYAAGQLVFGTLADRFEPKRLMSAGLLGSAACNLAFSFMPSF
ncbi:MAG: MFS transporter [Clostridia bacterium]|nr:MFS transporter [Clostridia bacterium]